MHIGPEALIEPGTWFYRIQIFFCFVLLLYSENYVLLLILIICDSYYVYSGERVAMPILTQ